MKAGAVSSAALELISSATGAACYFLDRRGRIKKKHEPEGVMIDAAAPEIALPEDVTIYTEDCKVRGFLFSGTEALIPLEGQSGFFYLRLFWRIDAKITADKAMTHAKNAEKLIHLAYPERSERRGYFPDISVFEEMIQEAFVIVDAPGKILYCNEEFAEAFSPGEDAVGQMLCDLVINSQMAELVERPGYIKRQIVSIEATNGVFYGFLHCRPLRKGENAETAFMLEKTTLFSGDTEHAKSGNRDVSFDWLKNAYFTADTIAQAKHMAEGDDSILLTGEDGAGHLLLARCIHAASARSEKPFLVTECSRVYRDKTPGNLLKLLGGFGNINGATVLFRNVDQMTISLQTELLSYLEWMEEKSEKMRRRADNRFIFVTTAHEGGGENAFSIYPELYKKISQNRIHIPPLRDNPGLVQAHVNNALAYYKANYQKTSLKISADAMDALYSAAWRRNLKGVEEICDFLVFNAEETVTRSMIIHLCPEILENESEQKTVSQFELHTIKELLASGESKDSIAKKLGISRATLYRKIRMHGIGK